MDQALLQLLWTIHIRDQEEAARREAEARPEQPRFIDRLMGKNEERSSKGE